MERTAARAAVGVLSILVLGACGASDPEPNAGNVVPVVAEKPTTTAPTPTTTPPTTTTTSAPPTTMTTVRPRTATPVTAASSASVAAASFTNCTAARAAGAAPVRRGSPGYGPQLDRDGDGIGCE